MNCSRRTLNWLLTTALLAGGLNSALAGKSYSSSGGHSYSSSSHSSGSGGSHSFSSGSHSFSSGSSSRSSSSGSSHSSSSGSGFSHSSSGGGSGTSTHSSGGSSSSGSTHTGTSGSSSSSGGSKSPASTKGFNSSSGKSYTSGSGSTYSDNDRRSYTSGKSYTADSGRIYSSSKSTDKAPSAYNAPPSTPKPAPTAASDSAPSSFNYDTAAARARKEEASKSEFTRFKESQAPRAPPIIDPTRSSSPGKTYNAKPPPIATSGGSYRTRTYIPDTITIRTRPTRYYTVFSPYYSYPVVVYRDPYDSFFWWWLLDRSLDDRAYWAYHHRYDMDPARYEALMERDQQLETRVAQLESQQIPREQNYTPPGVDRDLMYSDNYVEHNYSNRPTRVGNIAFWVFAAPLAIGFLTFFIWLIWFKRWQPAT